VSGKLLFSAAADVRRLWNYVSLRDVVSGQKEVSLLTSAAARQTGWRFVFALVVVFIFAQPIRAANIIIVNRDGPDEGLNDPTPVAPVGGNPGTTIGQQRLNVFQRGAEFWGARLVSSVPIRVAAQFNSLSCTANAGTLGSAGPVTLFRDFAGAPVAKTYYASALANALAGTDLDPAADDIDATFNSDVGT